MVQAIRRSANSFGHLLAREDCENKVSSSWLGVPPIFTVKRIGFGCFGDLI
jgi:hypothetical protein